MPEPSSLQPSRRAILQLLGGASALAIAGPSLASTGETLQDITSALPGLPEARVYVARKVITLEPGGEGADAVAVVGDRILGAGPRAEVEARLGDQPYVIDETFADKVIVPGLIDQHVHPVLSALTLTLEIIAIEDWVLPSGTAKAATSPEDYMARLTAAEAALTDPDQPLLTWGYHHYFHGMVRRADLDKLSTTRPILIWHRSAHELILNTAALEQLGITADLVAGFTEGAQGQSELDAGHFYEQGFFAVLPTVAPMLATPERLTAGLELTRDYLHRSGITMACEPGGVLSKPLQDAQNVILGGSDVPFRTYYLPDGKSLSANYSGPELIAQTEALLSWGLGRTEFLPKQVKLFADGAIYSQLMQMRDGYTDGHSGEWIMPPDVFNPAFDTYWEAGYQIHIHQNGDLGLDMVLDALERNMRRLPRADHRMTVVHFGYARADQVERLTALGAIVSANPYYVTALSDRYGEAGLGPERANALVPLGDVVARSVPVALHSDMPMAPAQPLFLVWAAASRATVSGRIAGAEQRLTVEQALCAVTIDAARTLRLETTIGSIAPGKMATFTILDEDPLTVEVDRIKDIGIWGTVFEGKKHPVGAVDPAKKASLRLPPSRSAPKPLYALAEVAPIAARGGVAGALACSCCGPLPGTCGPDGATGGTSMGCCGTNALGWAVAAQWAATA
jgi:predicted amidohydrolase YtcJ